MQRLITKCVVGFALLALWCQHGFAQELTIWQAKEGNWFDRQNWTQGIPNLESPANIPSGIVTASARQGMPSAARLSIGQRDQQQVSKAQLEVTGSSLVLLNELDVAHTDGEVTGILSTVGPDADVQVGGDVNLGVARSGVFARGKSTLNAEVNIEGSLLVRRGSSPGSSPTLRVGALSDDGSVQANVNVGGDISGERTGFSNTFVGVIEQNGFGVADARLAAENLFGNGDSSLLIGGKLWNWRCKRCC